MYSGSAQNTERKKCDISIIVINWHNDALVQKNINQLTEHPPKLDWELIVWDNSTRQDSKCITWDEGLPVRWIHSLENIGFGPGVNAAASIARGDCFMIMNPDLLPLPGAIVSLVEQIRNNQDLGALVPVLVDENKVPIPSIRPFPSWRTIFMESPFFLSFRYFTLKASRWRYAEPPGTGLKTLKDQPMGAAIVVSREMFKILQGFDERFFLFFEDVDFFYRLKILGKKTVMDTNTRVIHEGGASIRFAKGADAHFYRGFLRFMRKHHGMFIGVLERILLVTCGIFALITGFTRLLRGKRDGSIPTGLNMIKAALGIPVPKPVYKKGVSPLI